MEKEKMEEGRSNRGREKENERIKKKIESRNRNIKREGITHRFREIDCNSTTQEKRKMNP